MTRLEQIRLDKGLTRKALADASGVTRQTIAALESGDVSGRADTLFALATVLEARPSELLLEAVFMDRIEPGAFKRFMAASRDDEGRAA